jgi:hypothetical protein
MNENATTNIGYTIVDPEGGAVVIGLSSSNPLYANASYSGGQITINSGSVPSNQNVIITVTATDPVGNVSTRTITVTVVNTVITNNPPIISGVNVATLNENSTLNIGFSVQDLENENITLTSTSSLPTRATATLSTSTINSPTSVPRLFNLTINTSDVNVQTTVSITITATDTFGNSTSHVITTTVNNVVSFNSPPVIGALARYDMNESSTGSLVITVTDVDVADVIAISTVTSSNTSVLQVTGDSLGVNSVILDLSSLSVSQNEDEVISLTVNDGTNTVSRNFNVRVLNSAIAMCAGGSVGTLSYAFKGYTAHVDMMSSTQPDGMVVTATGSDPHPIRCETPYGSGGILSCTQDYFCDEGTWVVDGGTDNCDCGTPPSWIWIKNGEIDRSPTFSSSCPGEAYSWADSNYAGISSTAYSGTCYNLGEKKTSYGGLMYAGSCNVGIDEYECGTATPIIDCPSETGTCFNSTAVKNCTTTVSATGSIGDMSTFTTSGPSGCLLAQINNPNSTTCTASGWSLPSICDETPSIACSPITLDPLGEMDDVYDGASCGMECEEWVDAVRNCTGTSIPAGLKDDVHRLTCDVEATTETCEFGVNCRTDSGSFNSQLIYQCTATGWEMLTASPDSERISEADCTGNSVTWANGPDKICRASIDDSGNNGNVLYPFAREDFGCNGSPGLVYDGSAKVVCNSGTGKWTVEAGAFTNCNCK